MTPILIALSVALAGIVAYVIWVDSGFDDDEDEDDFHVEPFRWDEVCQRELDRHLYLLSYYKRCKAQEAKLYSKDEKFMMWSEWEVEAMRLGSSYVGRTPEEVVGVINRRIGELMFLKS